MRRSGRETRTFEGAAEYWTDSGNCRGKKSSHFRIQVKAVKLALDTPVKRQTHARVYRNGGNLFAKIKGVNTGKDNCLL